MKNAYLTFDDGPSQNTVKILEILKFYDIKATFFVVGKEGGFEKDIYNRILKDGHAIGNHTYSHVYKRIYSSVDAFKEDFYKLENLLIKIIGYRPEIFRFPGGSTMSSQQDSDITTKIATEMKNDGYEYFDWNVDSGDTLKMLQDIDVIIDTVLYKTINKESPVILMHDAPAKTTTPQALPSIITGLLKQGFSFETLTKTSPSCRLK